MEHRQAFIDKAATTIWLIGTTGRRTRIPMELTRIFVLVWWAIFLEARRVSHSILNLGVQHGLRGVDRAQQPADI